MKILVTGALGQIGSELTEALASRYGKNSVIATDKQNDAPDLEYTYTHLNVLEKNQIEKIIKTYNINTIYHLAAILSAAAEEDPMSAWDVNMEGLCNILEIAREYNCSLFTPSSIGVFGPDTPKNKTPQITIQRPSSIYGITKVSGELLCDYYYSKFGIDTRGLRYPGIISNKTLPGGGTTDYAVEIYYEALKKGKYKCFLHENTALDMMYMPDAVHAAIKLMEAPGKNLTHRNAFNITAMSVTPKNISKSIKKYIPDFKIEYEIDQTKQEIANSWPNNIDDSKAKKQWDWKAKYDLDSMTQDMLDKLSIKLGIDYK